MTNQENITSNREIAAIQKTESGRVNNLAARKTINLIWVFTSFVEALLGFRLLLKLISANPNSQFAAWIYQASSIFIAPFSGLVADYQIGTGVLEISTLIAMLVYIVITWLLIELVMIIFRW